MASQESIAVRQYLKAYMASQPSGFDLDASRKGLEMLASLTPIAQDISIEQTSIEGIHAEWVFVSKCCRRTSVPLSARWSLYPRKL